MAHYPSMSHPEASKPHIKRPVKLVAGQCRYQTVRSAQNNHPSNAEAVESFAMSAT